MAQICVFIGYLGDPVLRTIGVGRFTLRLGLGEDNADLEVGSWKRPAASNDRGPGLQPIEPVPEQRL